MAIHPYTRLFVLPSAPTVNEDVTTGYEVGDVVYYGGSIYDCLDNTDGAAVWQERGAGGAVTSVNGNTGAVVVDYASVSANDAATDVTAAELEELTDGSETTLHGHADSGLPNPFALTASITPADIAAQQNDYNPTGLSTADVLRLTASGSNQIITGIAGGSDGRILILHNIGQTYQLTFVSESASSAAENRFLLRDTVVLGGRDTLILRYDGTISRWRVFVHTFDKHAHTLLQGDGYQVDHTDLTSKGTNTHAQIDTHLSSQHITLADVYPVGSIYISAVSTNPATLFGFGTWAAFGAGRTLVGIDAGQTEFDTVEETGGAKTHTLTTGEMPSHNHLMYVQNNGTGGVNDSVVRASAVGALNVATELAGSGGAHNNLQPYIVVYMWKRTA